MKMKLIQPNMTSNKSNGYEVTDLTAILNDDTHGYRIFDGITNTDTQKDYPCYHSTNFNGDKVVVLKLPKKKN